LFVVLAAIWGSAFTAIKIGLDYFPPVMYAAFRYELATPIMIGYMLVSADRWRPRTTGEWLNIVASGVFIYAGYHAFSSSASSTPRVLWRPLS
jgi:drug/metabolite transporter (DMT)-like permease